MWNDDKQMIKASWYIVEVDPTLTGKECRYEKDEYNQDIMYISQEERDRRKPSLTDEFFTQGCTGILPQKDK